MIRQVDILVVGAGPAGLSAAVEARRAGASVLVVDENPYPGGQLFKQIHKFFGSSQHKAGVRGYTIGTELLQETKELGVEVELGYPVYGVFPEGEALVGGPKGLWTCQAKRIILATGANENNLPFQGSILPGVMTAGAAQTLINLHRVQPGQKVVMIGTGNVGLIVAYQLLQAHVEVVAMVEAGPGVGGYAVHSAKLQRAGVPFYFGHSILKAQGKDAVESVTLAKLSDGGLDSQTAFTLEADTVCMAVGLSPMVELAAVAGCKMTEIPVLGGSVPLHNGELRSTHPSIFVAGDITGVEEASTAMEEGRLAGCCAALDLGYGGTETQENKAQAILRAKSLRSGSFGEKRAQAKATILARNQEEEVS